MARTGGWDLGQKTRASSRLAGNEAGGTAVQNRNNDGEQEPTTTES
jgi:hypothetical protein